MQESNRIRKNEIKYNIVLNEEQKEGKKLIIDNQIVIITGRAGCGKSLLAAICGLDFLNKKQIESILVTRATIEVGKSLGYLPGDLNSKFDPYMEAIVENLVKCTDPNKIKNLIEVEKIKALPIQFIRGKTIDDFLILEEGQNTSKDEMIAVLTRLGKNGKIVITGDAAQRDTSFGMTGLDYVIELSKAINGIEHIKLKENHRSYLVGQILDYIYEHK